MARIELQKILDLDTQSTAGPWESTTEIGLAHEDTLWTPVGSTQADVPEATADAELIAHYRTAAPAMARALNAVLGAIEVLRKDNPRELVLLNALGILEGFIEKHLGEQE